MTTDTLSASVGSVAATTPVSIFPKPDGLKMSVQLHHKDVVGTAKRVTFTWEGYRMEATIWPQDTKRKRNWYFSVSNLQHPSHFRGHELPIFSAFLLACHQRLSNSIRDNRFNALALDVTT